MDGEEEAGTARSNREGKEDGDRGENTWKDKTKGYLSGSMET